MLQLSFIYRFFFGGDYIGSKKSAWCYDSIRFIETGQCCKPNLYRCIKMWQSRKYDRYMYRNGWHRLPFTVGQFLF